VVVAMLAGGTSSAGRSFRTGHRTSPYMPEASLRLGLATSSSTAIVRVFGSSVCVTGRSRQVASAA
jgi:hypothetical protein